MTQDYYGTRRVTAYEQERDGVPGYRIIYADGYTSWCPKPQFESRHQPISAMDFGHALAALNEGRRVSRWSWSPTENFLFKVEGSHFKVNREPLLSVLGEGADVQYHAHIDIHYGYTSEGAAKVAVWNPTQNDLLAEDWYIVGEV